MTNVSEIKKGKTTFSGSYPEPLTEGFDICHQCGAVQEYGTMQDINEVDFDIFCDDCLESKEEQ